MYKRSTSLLIEDIPEAIDLINTREILVASLFEYQ